MRAFHHGELLIGGMALRHLHGELMRDELAANSHSWLLYGQLHVSVNHGSQLELRRQYLLRIDDGREGIVELTSLTPAGSNLLADFRPTKSAHSEQPETAAT